MEWIGDTGVPLLSQSEYNDPQFLLRCAVTQHWEAIFRFRDHFERTADDTENYITSSLSDSLYQQVRVKDEWGNNILHLACFHKPPFEVVKAILKFADATSFQDIHYQTARDGSNPLQVACACGASYEVIQLLLKPPGRLKPGRNIVTHLDNQHHSAFKELLVHYSLSRNAPGNHDNPMIDDMCVSGSMTPLASAFWSKVQLLLDHSWHEFVGKHRLIREEGPYTLLHKVACVINVLPIELVKLVCRSFPIQARGEEHHVSPLHVVLLTARGGKKNTQTLKGITWFMDYLMSHDPPCSTRTFRNDRKSNLALALDASLPWQLEDGFAGPVMLLQCRNPKSVIEKCNSGFFPFQQAALGKRIDERMQLNTVFNLLRQAPDLLKR